MKRVTVHTCGLLAVLTVLVLSVSGQTQWRDLTNLTKYPNPSGDACSADGAPGASTEKKAENRLKNRFRLPPKLASDSVQHMLQMDPGPGQSPPASTDSRNNEGVVVEGYVRDAKPGGGSRRDVA